MNQLTDEAASILVKRFPISTDFFLIAVQTLTDPNLLRAQGLALRPISEWPAPVNEWIVVANQHWTGVAKFTPMEDPEFPEPEWQDETHEYIDAPSHWMPRPLLPTSPKTEP